MNSYNTLIVNKKFNHLIVTLHRPEARNSLNGVLIQELHTVLDEAEADDQCKVVVIRGENGIFCTGMDFQAVVDGQEDYMDMEQRLSWNQIYMNLLNRLATLSKVTVSMVEGQVMAGGIGIVAASDLVLANSSSTFSLTEALWGLLPSMVLPYLIRRVGYQTSYHMTLTAETFNTQEAEKVHLVDIAAKNVERSLSRLLQRLTRLQAETIVDLKRYFNQLVPITIKQANIAIQETARLSMQPRVMENIINFVRHQRFPWETTHE